MQQALMQAEPKQAARVLDPEACYAAVLARDASAVGQFYCCVRSTGIYCNPNCSARTPLRKNVEFRLTCDEAEAAGFRACLRCKPRINRSASSRQAVIAEACRLIEASETPPDLATLARKAGLSRFHFHRLFKETTGVTPKAYADAHRQHRVRGGLSRGESVTGAIYDAGFNSSGRFYESAQAHLGMTPTAFRAGGTGETIRFALGECSLGSILVAATARGVCAITLGDEPAGLLRDLQDRFPGAELIGGDEDFERLVARVVGLVDHGEGARDTAQDLPLDIRGTAFQRKVWEALRAIPAGTTASYSDIAEKIGAPRAVRAVAQACAANALAVAIPCHRVVRADGALSGYRWGVARKAKLLAREKAARPPAGAIRAAGARAR